MSQLALFEDEAFAGPKGLRYAREFVPEEVERELIACVAELAPQAVSVRRVRGASAVKSFGYRYDYTLQKLTESEPIPEWLQDVARSVEMFGNLAEGSVRQILCTEYDAGVGIGWHRDKIYFGKVFGLSLRSACKFRFRRRHGDKLERFSLQAKPRSLYLMQGEARQEWEHSIGAVEQLRYSITFRTMVDRASV